MQSEGSKHSAAGGREQPLHLPIAEIRSRAERVRLPLSQLAEHAGVAHSTATRRETKEPRSSTERALSAALVQFELELRDYLIRLHGRRRRT
jgi:predicted transcriptional regulator